MRNFVVVFFGLWRGNVAAFRKGPLEPRAAQKP
jgi:hypothetical protein